MEIIFHVSRVFLFQILVEECHQFIEWFAFTRFMLYIVEATVALMRVSIAAA